MAPQHTKIAVGNSEEMAKMVAIIDGEEVEQRLQESTIGKTVTFTQAWRHAEWDGSRPHLALIIIDDEISFLGRAQAGSRITTVDRIVRITEVQHCDPIPLEEIRQALPRRHQGIVDRIGILPERGGEEVVRVIIEMHPSVAGLIQSLQRVSEVRFSRGAAGELLNQERDGLGLLLGFAGVGRQVLRTWSSAQTGIPFLEGLPEGSVLEDHLIVHDTERFGSWLPREAGHVAWRSFTDGRRRIFVMNANRTAVEHTLGVDVVYWNEQRSSFVLVQYKKMRRVGGESGGSGRLEYRPDGNLGSELERMRQVDAKCTPDPGDFRLLSTPCWLKLCDPSSRVGDPADLIKGMYFAREHFEDLLETCVGPRGGTVITYENSVRHLTNTLFIELVQDGWIGSAGSGSEQIRELISESISTGHSVLLGVQTETTGT
jgi:hypothetical protein